MSPLIHDIVAHALSLDEDISQRACLQLGLLLEYFNFGCTAMAGYATPRGFYRELLPDELLEPGTLDDETQHEILNSICTDLVRDPTRTSLASILATASPRIGISHLVRLIEQCRTRFNLETARQINASLLRYLTSCPDEEARAYMARFLESEGLWEFLKESPLTKGNEDDREKAEHSLTMARVYTGRRD